MCFAPSGRHPPPQAAAPRDHRAFIRLRHGDHSVVTPHTRTTACTYYLLLRKQTQTTQHTLKRTLTNTYYKSTCMRPSSAQMSPIIARPTSSVRRVHYIKRTRQYTLRLVIHVFLLDFCTKSEKTVFVVVETHPIITCHY